MRDIQHGSPQCKSVHRETGIYKRFQVAAGSARTVSQILAFDRGLAVSRTITRKPVVVSSFRPSVLLRPANFSLPEPDRRTDGRGASAMASRYPRESRGSSASCVPRSGDTRGHKARVILTLLHMTDVLLPQLRPALLQYRPNGCHRVTRRRDADKRRYHGLIESVRLPAVEPLKGGVPRTGRCRYFPSNASASIFANTAQRIRLPVSVRHWLRGRLIAETRVYARRVMYYDARVSPLAIINNEIKCNL